MRKEHIKFLLLALIPVIIFSCVKKVDDNLDRLEKFYREDPSVAQVKFVHAYTPLTLGGSPAQSTSTVGFRIVVGGDKINGAGNTSTSTNTFLYGGTFPGTTAYTFLPVGSRTVKFVMNRITNGAFAPVSGDEYLSTNLNFAGGKKYSVFIADPYTSAYMVEDNYSVPGINSFGIRFINLCGDPASRFDVTSTRLSTKLFSDVGYKEMKDYVYLGVTGADTLYLKAAGTNTVIAQYPAAGSGSFTPGSQRVYTLYARGKTGVTGRTPSLSLYTNR